MITQETQTSQEMEHETKPIRCWTVALWAAAIALLAMLPTIVQYKGLYIIRGDYSMQFVPMMIEAKRLLAAGAPWWSHNVGFGSGAGVLLSGSPFFWLTMLFPEKCIPWAVGYIIVLKLTVAACFAFIALKMFVSSRSAAIGALLFTFSGYCIINAEFHPVYADVIAFFPLLFVGTERVLRRQKNGFAILITAVVLNVLVSFYMFAASSLFFLIYVLFRMFSSDINKNSRVRLLATLAFGYLLGIGLASLVMIPKIIVDVVECARAENGTSIAWYKWLFFEPQRYLELIRVFFMPSEGLAQHAFYPGTLGGNSTGIYLPVFGFTLAFMYLIRFKDWLSLLLLALLVMTFVPFLNSAFSGFSSLLYTRWWLGLSFILVIATVRILDTRDSIPDYYHRAFYMISLAVCAVMSVGFGLANMFPEVLRVIHRLIGFHILAWWADVISNSRLIGEPNCIIGSWLMAVINYFLLWFVLFRNKKYIVIMICVAIASICNFGIFLALNNQMIIYPGIEGVKDIDFNYLVDKTISQKQIFDSASQNPWRVDYPHEVRNYGRCINANATNVFISVRNRNSALFEEMAGCGSYSGVSSLLPFDRPALRSLLSVKYFVNYDPGDFKLTMPGYKFVKETAGTEIYENEFYVPMGFSYDTYISENQMTQYKDCIEKLMLRAVVLSDEQIEKYGGDMHKFASGPAKCADFDWMADALKMKKHTCTDYTADSKGFAARIELDAPRMVFFSIPYGAGWSAFVDGKPAQIEKVNIGFLGLMLPAGQHNIEFRYFPPGLKLGAIVSGISAIILLCYFIISARMLKRKAGGELAA